MFFWRNKIGIIFILLVVLSANVSAQSNFWEIEAEITRVLLKKDLRLAIKEAESSPANDLTSLLRRLSLYRRAADDDNFSLTVRQIIKTADFEKNRYNIYESVKYALKAEYFQDIETLQIYLQNFDFDSDIYHKFTNLCLQKRTVCDVGEFDAWLARKAFEASDKNASFYENTAGFDWIIRRINWRDKFGLDNSEILNQVVENVRKNPADLEAALRYLKLFRTSQGIKWLAENFTSKQAYDYYELGKTLSNNTNYSSQDVEENQQIRRFAVQFLQKSLSLPFDKQDIFLINSHQLRFVSIPPQIGNYEKQLRFWTKTELAETYKNLGEPQNAQPIVEELSALDKSDIMPGNPNYLAGAVQMASGARVVESKILVEQATRQNSYDYWQERVAYYRGRKEPERIFDSYLQSFAVVPFNLSNENSRERRLHFIGRFADFAEDEFGYYENSKESENWSDEERRKLKFWMEAENFLRREFEKTNSNVRYSYEMLEIISRNRFEKLSLEILAKNSDLLVNAAKLDLIHEFNNFLYIFLKLENVPQTGKDMIVEQFFIIAEKKRFENAWIICNTLKDIDGQTNFAARIIPILVKNLKIAENRLNLSKSSDEGYTNLEAVKNKYIEILFDAYLAGNDRKSAEKLLLEKYRVISINSLDRLTLSAVKIGAFDEAVRYWKIKANTDRRNLDNLTYLANYPAVAESLRKFYKQMKVDEPNSPIPNIALKQLR